MTIRTTTPLSFASLLSGGFLTAGSRLAAALRAITLSALLGVALAGCITANEKGPRSSAGVNPEILTPEQARSTLDSRQRAYQGNPSNRGAALEYATALRALDRNEEAAAVLERAIMSNPEDGPLARAYGQALIGLGQTERAVDVLNRAHAPDNPDWHVLSALGVAADRSGKHSDARAHYVSALRIAPNNPQLLANLALSWAMSGNKAEAMRALHDAETAAPRDESTARVRKYLEGAR